MCFLRLALFGIDLSKRIFPAKSSGDVLVTRVIFVGFVRFCVKVVGA